MVNNPKRSLWAWLSRLLMLSFAGGFVLNGVFAQPGVSLYTIQVVFHVLHQNGPENISDAQIESAITVLNAHFDAPTVAIDPPFDAIAADMDIAFVLASTAPDGSPTSGIERIETPLTNMAGSPETYLDPWPRNSYMNIWVVKTLASGQALDWKSPAEADPEPCVDGLMIMSDFVAPVGEGTITLTYGTARFLNLKRMWQDAIGGGLCGDDEVADTPICIHPPDQCFPDPNTCDVVEMNFENFMNTAYCSKMFTLGQRERVHACLNSPVAQRNELASVVPATSTDCTVGIRTLDPASALIITPMPFNDRITISGLPSGNHRMELQDMSGRTVASNASVIDGKAIEIDTDLPAGVYVLALGNAGARISRLVMKY